MKNTMNTIILSINNIQLKCVIFHNSGPLNLPYDTPVDSDHKSTPTFFHLKPTGLLIKLHVINHPPTVIVRRSLEGGWVLRMGFPAKIK